MAAPAIKNTKGMAISVFQRQIRSTDNQHTAFEEVACYYDRGKYTLRMIAIAGFYPTGSPRYTILFRSFEAMDAANDYFKQITSGKGFHKVR